MQTAPGNEVDAYEVTRELLLRYDRPGPRYTSYPTAPEWREDFSDEDYGQALDRAAVAVEQPFALYVHVPFCRKRCAYCGCNTACLERDDQIAAYLDSLDLEIALVAARVGRQRPVKQLHWGGGTPTTLDPAQMRRLFGTLAAHFVLADDAEIAIEVDPRVTTRDHMRTLRDLGFNRVSMGVQDLDPAVQAAIGRNQTEEQTRSLFTWCREDGFRGVNMDLIYGLPYQTLDTWTKTVRKVIDIGPDRMALYSFAYLPSRLENQQRIDPETLPTGPDKYELFATARRLFVEAGYRTIGMDHFARPDDELAIALDERRLNRNFMGYTTMPADEMIGLGASAIGNIGGCYAQNEKTTAAYAARVAQHRFATARGCLLSDDDRLRAWVIRQLMCTFHLDSDELRRRFGVVYADYFAAEEEALTEYYNLGFLVRENGNLRVLPLGQVFIRNLAMVFDAYLAKPTGHQQFSRTI